MAEDPDLLAHPVIGAVARRRSATPAQVLLAWGVARGTSVIPKSVTPRRLRENLAAADVALDAEDLADIGALDADYRFVDGSFWAPPGSPYSVQDLWS
jgi:alcohol dehydrogenase (NADP+)